MVSRKTFVFVVLGLMTRPSVTAQTQSTGRIAGIVRDVRSAAIVGALVSVENPLTADKHVVSTDVAGNYSILQLPPGTYDVRINAPGFTPAIVHQLAIGLAETTTLNTTLQIAHSNVEIVVSDAGLLVRSDSSELSSVINSRSLEALPLPTRNLLQLLTLGPGVTSPLTNNSAIGRNSPNVSINGSRVTQNGYQINGVDATDTSLHVFADVGVPAPESVAEVNAQTSLYDASVPGAGGSVQVITKNGTNFVHGAAYEYFRNESLNANDANLKAVGERRPVMRRNVYGGTLGGPLRKDHAFFFVSYEGSREANGATDQSLYKGVLIANGLTDDRSAATLSNTFGVSSIDPISLKLLNLKLPNGQFLIPTPQTSTGRITGTALSTYHEEQFNANVEDRLGSKDSLSAKFFFAHAPLFSALSGSNFGSPSSLPGFGTQVEVDNRVFSLQEIHSFSSRTLNEARFGYGFIRHDEKPQESFNDSAIGIERSTSDQYPGLPLIMLGRDEGGASIGSSDITYRGSMPSLSLVDILSLQRGRHAVRIGGEILHSEWRVKAAVLSYGDIEFPTFRDFLLGNTGPSQFIAGTSGFSHLGTGLTHRDFRTTDYHLFIQDDWRLTSKLTVNLGVRYELDPPPYDTQGRIGGFDPGLYRARMQVDGSGFPLGPPLSGIIEAGNAPSRFSLPGVLRVGKRMVKSIDPNNFGPRIGLAWAPLDSGRLALRGGYGIFYSRPSFAYLALQYFAPPFFLDSDTSGQPFSNPFATAPPESSFPLLQSGSYVTGTVIDRNARTPYIQQFNGSAEYQLPRHTTLQLAYVGSRGVKLFRGVAINQARIASSDRPLRNEVTGQLIVANSIDNAPFRAPLQGVSTAFFSLNESTAQSSYDSVQATFKRQISRGFQFSAAYTFSKSIDNASNPGGGVNTNGTLDRSGGLDTGNVWDNNLQHRANRGLSDFDRTHCLVFNYVWDLPHPSLARSSVTRAVLSNWELSGIVMLISGLPTEIFDPAGGLLYGLFGARPNWAPGANAKTARINVPAGYYFNPSAFSQAIVQPGQPIPSAMDPLAMVDPLSGGGIDIGNVGRNILHGPSQKNVDLSVARRLSIAERTALEFRADFFNLLNHANRDNPVSDISTVDFGKILTFSSSPRILQLAFKLTF